MPKREHDNKSKSQIKSKKRVKDHGEVFTNEREVRAMCDLIPSEIWENISSTFLEPACGNGNFIVEILRRKLEQCNSEQDAMDACASVYGIDILQDNVNEARQRCCMLVREYYPAVQPMDVFHRNIVVGDFLRPETVSFLKE